MAGWSGKVLTFAAAAFVFLSHSTKASTQAGLGLQAAPAADQFFDSNGVRIRYFSVGQGEPIILIHGWAADAEMWLSAVQDLSRNYRVIALDCRGHGKSGKPTDPSQYGMEMVNDIVRLMDHLGIAKAHVLGYSMGGSITIKMLTVYPQRFLTAVIGGSQGFRPEDVDTPDTPLIRSLLSGMSLTDADCQCTAKLSEADAGTAKANGANERESGPKSFGCRSFGLSRTDSRLQPIETQCCADPGDLWRQR